VCVARLGWRLRDETSSACAADQNAKIENQ